MSHDRSSCRAIWIALSAFTSLLPADLVAADPIGATVGAEANALRESGRAAHARREFTLAAELLGKARAMTTSPDPELHYLLGEALWVLGREAEARVAYARARHEIGRAPTTRMPRLWLARIHGRSGELAAADAIYDAMIAETPADPEVAMAKAEMHAAARDWVCAEASIRRFLSVRPTHRGARELLAWITEAQGRLDLEIEIRESLANDSTDAQPVHDYGRALERAGDWAGALAMYRRAQHLAGGADDHGLEIARRRMDQRMSIEVAAGAIARSDPAASAMGGFTGVALPFGKSHHAAIGASFERISTDAGKGALSELFGALSLRGAATRATGGARIALLDLDGIGVTAMSSGRSTAPGAFGTVRRRVGDHVELGLDGEINTMWREAPRALLDGGRIDAVTSHLWVSGFEHRLVVDAGAQLRRARLRSDGNDDRSSFQLFAWAGADYLVWQDFSKQAAGEVLDESLLQPTFLASSIVSSYRHYESFTSSTPEFMERMTLAERASIDEASVTIRRAMVDGRLAIEGRTGAGYDWARALWLARAGLSLWIATGSDSRLSLTVDLAKESARALEGERFTGGMTYHVDL